MDVQGKLIEVEETQRITDTFQKREFVIEYVENPQYPEYLKFELIQDKCSLMDPFSLNDNIRVHFNLKGRKWTDREGKVRYFNSLQAWKIDGASEGSSQGNSAPPPPPPPPPSMDDDNDVLPF